MNNNEFSSNDAAAQASIPPLTIIRTGHVGDIVVPNDGRRPYTVIHPDYRRPRGMPKSDEEHEIKRAYVRLLNGAKDIGGTVLDGHFHTAHRFCTSDIESTAA